MLRWRVGEIKTIDMLNDEFGRQGSSFASQHDDVIAVDAEGPPPELVTADFS